VFATERDVRPLTRSEVEGAYSSVFRPDRITLAVYGVGAGEELELAWRNYERHWKTRANLPFALTPTLAPSPPALDGIALRGRPKPWSTSRLLAIGALGVGKGSAVFQAWRSELGASYQQEGALVSTEGGFTPVLWARTDSKLAVEDFRKALLENIESWQEIDRLRAVGVLKNGWQNGIPVSPFVGTSHTVLSSSNADRTYLTALWRLKTGTLWEPSLVWNALDSVSLEDLKSSAIELVETALLLDYRN
jgi:hypothetical protein